jgi:hypothetical protein
MMDGASRPSALAIEKIFWSSTDKHTLSKHPQGSFMKVLAKIFCVGSTVAKFPYFGTEKIPCVSTAKDLLCRYWQRSLV